MKTKQDISGTTRRAFSLGLGASILCVQTAREANSLSLRMLENMTRPLARVRPTILTSRSYPVGSPARMREAFHEAAQDFRAFSSVRESLGDYNQYNEFIRSAQFRKVHMHSMLDPDETRNRFFYKLSGREPIFYGFSEAKVRSFLNRAYTSGRAPQSLGSTSTRDLVDIIVKMDATLITEVATVRSVDAAFIAGGRPAEESSLGPPSVQNASILDTIGAIGEFLLTKIVAPFIDTIASTWLSWRNAGSHHMAYYNPLWQDMAQEVDGLPYGSRDATNRSVAAKYSPSEIMHRDVRYVGNKRIQLNKFRGPDGNILGFSTETFRLSEGGQLTDASGGFFDVFNAVFYQGTDEEEYVKFSKLETEV